MGRSMTDTDEEATLYSPTTSIENEKRDELKTAGVVVHPPDTGLHAWLFLIACFLIEGLALGEPPKPKVPSSVRLC